MAKKIDDGLHFLIHSKAAWWTLALLVLLGCGADILNTLEYGSVDLRNRVVGARLLVAGENPYRYVWQTGDPEALLDPLSRRSNAPDNRISVSPGALALYAIFSNFHFRSQQVIWLILQWAAALGTLFLLANAASPAADRRFLVMIIAFFFLTGESWRFHVERGQIYVFYALILAAGYRVGRLPSPFSGFACGVLLGIGVLLRPTFVMISIPFLISKRWRIVAGGLCGILLGAMITAPVATPAAWRSYLSGMESIGQFYLQTGDMPKHLQDQDALPQIVEGMDNLSNAKRFDLSPVRLYAGTFPAPRSLRSFLLKGACLLFVLVFSARLWRRWKPDPSLETCLIVGITLMMGVDFFMPAPRQAYNNIIWCVPLGLLVVREGAHALFRGRAGSMLCVGLIFACGIIQASAQDAIGLSNLVVAIYFIIASLRMASDSEGKEHHETS